MRYKCIIKYELEVPCSRKQLLSEARVWEKENRYCYGEDEDALMGDYVLTLQTHSHNETPEVVEVEDRG